MTNKREKNEGRAIGHKTRLPLSQDNFWFSRDLKDWIFSKTRNHKKLKK